jgi:hypothetical protein
LQIDTISICIGKCNLQFEMCNRPVEVEVMRMRCSLLVALGLGWYFAGPAGAQTQELPRYPTFVIPKAKNEGPEPDARTTPVGSSRGAGGAYESRGVVYVEEIEIPKAPRVVTQPATPSKSAVPMPTPTSRGSLNVSSSAPPPPTAPLPPIVATPAPTPVPQAPIRVPATMSRTSSAPLSPVAAPITVPVLVAPTPAPPPVPSSAPRPAPQLPVAAPITTPQPPIKPVAAIVDSPIPTSASDPLNQRLTEIVSKACPHAHNVRVSSGAGNELNVEMEARSVEECNILANRVFAIRDLDPYRVNIKFQVPQN